jgi:hypothetical protein
MVEALRSVSFATGDAEANESSNSFGPATRPFCTGPTIFSDFE